MKLFLYGKTDIGKVRQNNEDNFLVDNDISLAIVADGMGGHKNGELASNLAVKITREKFIHLLNSRIKPNPYYEKYSLNSNRLSFAVQIANNVIYETGKSKEENKGMGTTLTSILFNSPVLSLVHIGDSRAYLFRDNKLEQFSQDHSLVMEQVRKGIISKEQAENSPLQNILMKALGTQNKVQLDILEKKLKLNDKILLCSDGLFKCLKESEILNILKLNKTIEETTNILIDKANENGGLDNITIVLGIVKKITIKEKIKEFIRKINL